MWGFVRIFAKVFPAYAGVILTNDGDDLLEGGLSRIRGGDPRKNDGTEPVIESFPHTRG